MSLITHCLLPLLLFATALAAAAPFAHVDDHHYMPPFQGQPTNKPPPERKQQPSTDHKKPRLGHNPPPSHKLQVQGAMPEETYKKPSLGHNRPPISGHNKPLAEKAVADQQDSDEKPSGRYNPPPPPPPPKHNRPNHPPQSSHRPPVEATVADQLADEKRSQGYPPPPPSPTENLPHHPVGNWS